jgi:hypothetical protein
VRQPWARDPSYYATVFGEESDVPAHEGPSADTIASTPSGTTTSTICLD